MTTICTGFSPSGYLEYGKQFLETFEEFWPPEIRLLAYTEEPVAVPREGLRSLWSCPGVREFIDRHKENALYNGREEFDRWRPKDRGKPYAYRWDAVKFSRQLFIPETAAAELQDGEALAWVDGDVITHGQVPANLVEQLLGKHDLCYLGRIRFHSELGFWAVRLNRRTRAFLKEIADLYRSDRVFELHEWHSAFVFDHLRSQTRLNVRNLTPGGFGHVWFQCPPIAKCLDHLKGDQRKQRGHSLERRHGPRRKDLRPK